MTPRYIKRTYGTKKCGDYFEEVNEKKKNEAYLLHDYSNQFILNVNKIHIAHFTDTQNLV